MRAPIAEDWDGLGFVSSVKTFDLAAFSPHPPGYPVYVALLRLVALVVRDAALAGAVVSAASGALCAYYTFQMLAPRVGRLPALSGACSGAVGSLVLRASSQVGTEALGLAFLLGALHVALAEPGEPGESGESGDMGPDRGAPLRAGLSVGLSCGLALGVRLSWWPLYLGLLALVANRARIRALVSLGVGVLVWAIPLALFVGPRKLAALFAAHGEGHAHRFGRTLLQDGDVGGHLAALARDLTADGLGLDGTGLGVVLSVVAALGFARFVSLWANGALSPRTAIPISLLAYAVFVTLFQNVIESPRHVVPIVYAGSVATGVALATPWPRLSGKLANLPSLAALVFALMLAARGANDALDRTAHPPLGAQLVDRAHEEPGLSAGAVAIFGGDSARFAIMANIPGGYAENLGDVHLALGAMRRLPTVAYVTGEVSLGGPGAALPHGSVVCRPVRLDRKHACMPFYRLEP